MNLFDVLRKIAIEYSAAKTQALKGHSLASFIRKEIPDIVNPLTNNTDLEVKASEGKGGWAESPWIAIINKKMTDAPQEGVYVVYLFSSDLSRVYLTLAQGITRLVDSYGRKDAFRRLRANAENIRANFPLKDFDDYADVELGEGNRASAYEESVIYAKKYSTTALPENDELENDLKNIVGFYGEYLNQRDVLTAETDFSSSIGEVEEGKRLLIHHYLRARNLH